MLSNYLQYDYRNNYNHLYNATLYEQVSIAKEFSSTKFEKRDFTVYLSYFWDYSLVNPKFSLSGVKISLSFNL